MDHSLLQLLCKRFGASWYHEMLINVVYSKVVQENFELMKIGLSFVCVSCGTFIDNDISNSEIDLKKVLDYCYNLAFHMPLSPTDLSQISPILRNGLVRDVLGFKWDVIYKDAYLLFLTCYCETSMELKSNNQT